MRTDAADAKGLLPEGPSGYDLRERLVIGPSSVVYRGVARVDGNAVLLTTTRGRPSSRDVSDFSREYAILTRISGAPIVHALGHEVIEGRPWLILEDVGGQPLTSVVARFRAPDRAVTLALEISLALAEVHRRGIVHQRLEPRHIIVLDDGTVRLTGFASSTERLSETPTRMLDGTLAYVAPEQTGRLNLQVDERADLYAFGVVLFELLTGTPPFDAPDAAGWIHAHLAKQPAAPDSLDHRIAPSLSAIVLKLLAKDPADRYQHARGLARDLERCATALSHGDQTRFELGTDDVTDVFRVSERLHGREREVARLVAGFERAIADCSCVISLVPGYSGIGKTSVVSALYQPVARERGRFISGKFDQYKRDIPYQTIVQAFRGLMRDVLSANAEPLADWRRRVGDALGANAGVLADVIPELSTLLGPLPPIAELGPREAQNRFERVFLAFVRVFARVGHPLVLFLDDMQWADDATLGLLQSLGAPSAVPSLHVVLAYRDNEVGPDHRFALAVDALRAEGATLETIPVRDLEPPHVIALVAETVNRTSHDSSVRALALALSEKTGGNPFFIRELLQQLHGRGLFAFDAQRNRWDWDERATDAVDVAGNVVDLLVMRLSNLPVPMQRTLAVAACFGNRFDIESLAEVLQMSAGDVSAALSGARRDGLVVAVGDSCDTGAFRFHHDRIQQAAYSRLADDERTLAHLHIGRVLRARFQDGSDDLLFDAVEHLNRARTIASDPGERREITLLNLAAGRRAKAAAAWGPAQVYFENAVSLGGEHAWTSHRDETFGAVRDLAECDFLTGRFDRAAIHFDDLRGRSVSRIERAGVVTLHVRLLIVTGRYDDALDLAVRELESFGVSFPIGDPEIAAAIEVGHRRLEHFDFQSMAAMPVLGDSEPRALINLLASLPPAVYSRRPAILPLLAMKIVQLSIEHGNCEASCFGYSLYAMILAATLGEPARALELSQASIALTDRLDDPRLRAPAVHIHANHILFWSRGYDTAIPFLQRAYEAAMHVGDITIAAYVTFMGAWQEIERGHEVTETQRALAIHDARAEASRHATARDVVRLQIQFGRALAGETLDPLSLTTSDFDADAARLRISAAGLDTGLVTHDLLRAMLAWLHGRFAEAEAALECGSAALAAAYCLPIETTWALFDALTAAALWDDASAEARGTLSAKVRSAEARLRRWANDCPENFEAKHALVLAEMARLDGRTRDADREYEHAFVAARRSGMLHLQVIASQLAARVALASGLEHVARTWLREQHDVLRAWGATALVTAMEATHPYLRTTASEASGGLAQLDALAAIKASHALSRA
nr:AAA family ATPase [Deltaproteobacteria bacterium]